MGNLCSLIDCDSIDVPTRPSHYQTDNVGYQPDRQQNQLASSLDQKRQSQSSSPDRRGNHQRDAAHGGQDQTEQHMQQHDMDLRRAAAHEEDGEDDSDLSEHTNTPFSWTKGELIGIGAFGRVFSGLNNITGELVAVKQVSFAKDETLQGRVAEHIKALEAEVAVLKTLKHENIVQYLGTERTEDSIHIFLEYVPGGSIASLLAKFGPFQESVIRVYTRQILRGLEYLHQKGIMHRDIKGANILVDKKGTVKLADFGASKKIEDLATVGSGCKSIRGTPYWMAPEVIKQTGHGRPADIWSVGCTVIEMATGKPPWSSYAAPVAAMFQIASSKDPPPLPEHLSVEAKDFLLLCFNRVARDRANATRLLKHPFVTGSRSCPSNSSSSNIPASLTPPRPLQSAASNAAHTPAGQQQQQHAAGGAKSASPGTQVGADDTPSRQHMRGQQQGTPGQQQQQQGGTPGGRMQSAGSMQQRQQSQQQQGQSQQLATRSHHPQQQQQQAVSTPRHGGQRSQQPPGSQQQQQQQQQLTTPRGSTMSSRQAYMSCQAPTPGQQQAQQQQRRASPQRQQRPQQLQQQEVLLSPRALEAAGSSPAGGGVVPSGMRNMALHSSMYMRGDASMQMALRMNNAAGLPSAQQQQQQQQQQNGGGRPQSSPYQRPAAGSAWQQQQQQQPEEGQRGSTAAAAGGGGGRLPWPVNTRSQQQGGQQQQQPQPDILGPLRSNAASAAVLGSTTARTFTDWNPMEEPAWGSDPSQQQQQQQGRAAGSRTGGGTGVPPAHRRRATSYGDEDEEEGHRYSRQHPGQQPQDSGSTRGSADRSQASGCRSSSTSLTEDAPRGRDSPKPTPPRQPSSQDLTSPGLKRVSDTSSTSTRRPAAAAGGAAGVAASSGSEDLQAWLAVATTAGQQQRKAAANERAQQGAVLAAAAAALAADDADDDVRMSKRAQWEQELYEELARHRQEHRATRAVGGAGGL